MSSFANEPIIRIRDLVVAFGDRTVLDGVSLDIQRGEIIGLVGGSGSGKSVLLRTIIGLLSKRSGAIDILGHNTDSIDLAAWHALRENWGVLFQHGALFSSLTALQNVQFPMRQFLQAPETMLDGIAATKLAMVGLLPQDINKFPSELSGGMTKRVALARALSLDPSIVFLDEPTSGLDPISAGDFDTLIATLKRTLGLTVFMVTHDLNTLHMVCDRVAVLSGGKIVADGTIPEMLRSEHPWVKSYFRGVRGRLLEQHAGHEMV